MFIDFKHFKINFQNTSILLKSTVNLTLTLLLSTVLGCSSFHKKLMNTSSIGMTKKQILKRFHEPHEKYRTKGQDHWVYETSKKAKNKTQGQITYKHTLIFEEGILISAKFKRAFTNKELTDFYSN